MIVDFRYHVASLVAVFLALGLGILIGTAMLGNDVLVESQKQMIDRLERDTNSVRTENRALQVSVQDLQGQLEKERQFEESVLPALLRNRLAGRKVALVTTTDTFEPVVVDSIKSALKAAGAQVTSNTRINQLPSLMSDKRKEKVVSVLQLDSEKTEVQVVEALAQEVANDISMGTNVALGSLKGMKLVQTSGVYDTPVDSVVLLTGREEEPAAGSPKVDEVIAKGFKDMAVDVVGVETSDSPWSQMKALKQVGISTVDNVQTVPGLLAMVMSLQGAAGSYGTKDTAKQLVPDLSLWAQ